MSTGEFDLIARYFTRPVKRSPLGVGDDCALLAPAAGMQLAVSSDMLVEGRHFLSTVSPERLGHKALAVNLSDLAACGARPLAFTLALALPAVDEAWLEGFSRRPLRAGRCARLRVDRRRHHARAAQPSASRCSAKCPPVAHCCVRARRRVTTSGSAARSATRGSRSKCFAERWRLPAEQFELARARMEQPTPRVALGQALRGIAIGGDRHQRRADRRPGAHPEGQRCRRADRCRCCRRAACHRRGRGGRSRRAAHLHARGRRRL